MKQFCKAHQGTEVTVNGNGFFCQECGTVPQGIVSFEELNSWNMVCHRTMATLCQTDWGLQMLSQEWDEYMVMLLG